MFNIRVSTWNMFWILKAQTDFFKSINNAFELH